MDQYLENYCKFCINGQYFLKVLYLQLKKGYFKKMHEKFTLQIGKTPIFLLQAI